MDYRSRELLNKTLFVCPVQKHPVITAEIGRDKLIFYPVAADLDLTCELFFDKGSFGIVDSGIQGFSPSSLLPSSVAVERRGENVASPYEQSSWK